MKRYIKLVVEVPDDTTDNEILCSIEKAVGQITSWHNPEVMDISDVPFEDL